MENQLVYRICDPGVDGDDLLKCWDEQVGQEDELKTLGTMFTMTQCEDGSLLIANDLDDAVEMMKTAAVPYCGAVCVAFHALVKSQRNAVYGFEQRHRVALDKLSKVIENTRKMIHNTKSKTIGCKQCGSTITRSYIGDSFECPVCGDVILAETYKKALIKAQTDVGIAENNLPSEEDRYEMVNGICYIIGGWKV